MCGSCGKMKRVAGGEREHICGKEHRAGEQRTEERVRTTSADSERLIEKSFELELDVWNVSQGDDWEAEYSK